MQLPNQVLQNRYVIQSLLGQGGMGSVYRAHDQTLNRAVAIKESIPDPNGSPQGLAQARVQFQREAQILAGLSHPNLPHTYDYFSFGGNEYVVMELIQGQSLDQVVQQHGAINEGAVLAWANQILDALIYIHSQNVIHRDIKPSNIILKPDGRVVLVDFGLVKLIDPNNPRTFTAMRGMGTPEYAPLEQFSPGMHTDARSDIYSLGATLYQLLAGRAPVDVPARMLNPAQQPTLRALNPKISANTETVVEKAMEVYPQNRFQSASAMKQALGTSPLRPSTNRGGVGGGVSQPTATMPAQPVYVPRTVTTQSAQSHTVPSAAPASQPQAYTSPTPARTAPSGISSWVWLGIVVVGSFFLLFVGSNLFARAPVAPTAAPPTAAPTEAPPTATPKQTAVPTPAPPTAAPTKASPAATPKRTAAAPIASSAAGTWTLSDSWHSGTSSTLILNSDGTLSYEGGSTANGTWSQNGNTISFQINTYSYWNGVISGATMSGTMSNINSMQGTWNATRQ